MTPSRDAFERSRAIAIAGAGTFNGVFPTGILAGLLAAWMAPAPRHPALVAVTSAI